MFAPLFDSVSGVRIDTRLVSNSSGEKDGDSAVWAGRGKQIYSEWFRAKDSKPVRGEAKCGEASGERGHWAEEGYEVSLVFFVAIKDETLRYIVWDSPFNS